MKSAGTLLMSIGVVVALFAFMMDTTVSSSGTFIAGSYIGGSSTYNLGLLQQQMMVFQSGLAAFVAGAFLYGSAARGAHYSESPSPGIPASSGWRRVREDETEEEREERLTRVRRTHIAIACVLAAVILALIVLASWSTTSSDTPNYMNVDENLLASDMNAL
jgi:hypothetical protein